MVKINIETIKNQIIEYLNNGGEDIINNNFTKNIHYILIYENFLI